MNDAPSSDAVTSARTYTAPRSRVGLVASTLLLAAWLGACASTPEPTLIALPSATRSSVDGAGAQPAGPSVTGVLLVRRLHVPEYMVSRRVRYASDSARVAEWPDTYWAERIEFGMARELVAALREALPAWRVCDASCGDVAPDLVLKVELQRIDVLRATGRIVAIAQTQVSPMKTGMSVAGDGPGPGPGLSPARYQTFTQPLPADTAQGQAQAMTDLLRAIADASALAVMQSRGTAPPAAIAP